MSVREAQIVRELLSYIHAFPAEQMALMPVYDSSHDHVRRGECTHEHRCPLVMTGAVVVDEHHRVLCLRHDGGYALAEAEPEDKDDSLKEAALRLLAEEAGVHDVWTDEVSGLPFLIDVTRPGLHRYGPRLRVGVRYLFRAHSGAVFPESIATGAAAWLPLSEINIPHLRDRLQSHLIGVP
ncbi:NUDIX domain-containing protein [Streptomyces sp. NPDC050988]|uniref:NUDIX domain-containing protein n=1 Tax=Streptomyces sp. NPDC050988 TaxID=3365637 RepID=UPI00379B032F